MKAKLVISVLLFTAVNFCSYAVSAQKNKTVPLDSALEANSEKWKAKLHKGFGLGKPEFGPYATLSVEKLDSPVLKTKTKEGAYSGATITSDSWDWEFSKYQTTEKKKAYRMLVTAGADTSELLFSLYSVSHDKQLTFFGDMISKDDEGKNMTLGYRKNISGIIATNAAGALSRFFIEDSFSRNETSQGYFNNSKRTTGGYIIAELDSLYAEPIMQQIGKPGDKYSFSLQKGIFIKNTKGDRIAALKFGTAGDLSNPFYVWMRKDVLLTHQHAIASLFALCMILHES